MSIEAIKAYSQAQRLHKSAIPPLSTDVTESISFKDMVGSFKDTVSQVKKAEEISMEGVKGTADPLSVVTALNKAYMNLQTLTTLTTKSIQALQDIKSTPL